MYREMIKFEQDFPPSRFNGFLNSVYDNFILFFFEKYIRNIKLGSPQWHIVQNKLSRETACGLGMKKRVKFYETTLRKCGKNLLLYPNVFIAYPQGLELGETVLINWGCHITAKAPIQIGDYSLIGPYCVINSGNHIYDNPDAYIRYQGHRIAPITIEKDVWLGSHVTILPGVTIGEGSVIGAGSVVNKSVEKYTVVGGVPAHFIKRRSQ